MKLQLNLHFFTLLVLTYCLSCGKSNAQIVPDGTLSTEVNSSDGLNFSIEGGDRVGNNLFHSFQDFSVPTDGSAVFNQAIDIETILSRVTGNSLSNIDGLIRANGAANLFLINPNGIIFGPNARLDIGGSFLATTANSVVFENGLEFSAANPENMTPLLSVNIPLGVQFGENPGDIVVRGEGFPETVVVEPLGLTVDRDINNQIEFLNFNSGLYVETGETLALVGGNLNLEGARLKTPSGRIELGSVSENQRIGIEFLNQGWQLDYTEVSSFRDIALNQETNLVASGEAGGEIRLQGRNINLAGNSLIAADTLGDRGGIGISVNAQNLNLSEGSGIRANTLGLGTGGNLNITASQQINFRSESALQAIGVDGNAGNITLETAVFSVAEGSTLSNSTFGRGNAGEFTIEATESVELVGRSSTGFRSGLFSSGESGAEGAGGSLQINTTRLSVLDGANIAALNFGRNNAGNLAITASEFVEVRGYGSSLGTSVAPGAEGEGGNLTINTARLILSDMAQIGSGTFGRGNGGDLTVNASELVELSGRSLLSSSVQAGAVGNGGNLTIDTNRIYVNNGSQITTDTFDRGNSGNLTIRANDRIEVVQNGLVSVSVEPNGVGNSGNLSLETSHLRVENGGVIAAGTFGNGNAGNLTIYAYDKVEVLNDGLLSVSVQSSGIGNGGSLILATPNLRLTDGGQILAGTFGSGNAGNLTIYASDEVEVLGDNASVATIVNWGAEGNAGNLNLNTARLRLSDGGQISVSTRGQGNAGNLTVTAAESVEISGMSSNGITVSNLSASVDRMAVGDGGNLTVETDRLTLRDRAEIDVSSFGQGSAGNLTINAESILLENSAFGALTLFGDRGNITLDANDLVLRRGSHISTTSLSSEPGGNITLNTGVLAALENSDISANAANSFGGRVTIDAQGIFGTAFRERLTPESDITATSALGPQFSGIVEINTPDIDATAGLVELPENIEIPRLARGCQVGGVGEARFVDVGRAGVPPTPYQPLSSDGFVEDRRLPRRWRDSQSPETSLDTSFQEAQNWIISDNDRVVLFSEETSTRQFVPCRDR